MKNKNYILHIRPDRGIARGGLQKYGEEMIVRVFLKLQSIVLEVDFYSRGSKLFMYVNPFVKRSNRKQN